MSSSGGQGVWGALARVVKALGVWTMAPPHGKQTPSFLFLLRVNVKAQCAVQLLSLIEVVR